VNFCVVRVVVVHSQVSTLACVKHDVVNDNTFELFTVKYCVVQILVVFLHVNYVSENSRCPLAFS